MGIIGWILYLVFSMIGFLLLLFIDKKYHITKVDKIILSLLYLFLIAGLFYRLKWDYTENIFVIFIFFFVIDLIYHYAILDKDFFQKEEGNVFYYVVLLILGFFFNQEFINRVNDIFLSGEEIRLLIWIGILFFIYRFAKEKDVFNRVNVSTNSSINEESIMISYAKLKVQYHELLDSEDKDLQTLMYAFMIYYNNSRNKLFRQIDNLKMKIHGSKRRLGIMQVEVDHVISDSLSIEIALDKIKKNYKKSSSKKIKIKDAIHAYDMENEKEIESIFDILLKF